MDLSSTIDAIDILIDVSNSMGDPLGTTSSTSKYDVVVKQLHSAIAPSLKAGNSYGVAIFGGRSITGVSCHVERLANVKVHPLSEIEEAFNKLPKQHSEPAGTPLADAIANSLEQLTAIKARSRSIVVLSDGDENCSKNATMDQVRQRARDLSIEIDWGGLRVFAIGIGQLPESLEGLSSATNGFPILLEPETTDADAALKLREAFVDIGAASQAVILRRAVERAIARAIDASKSKETVQLEASRLSQEVTLRGVVESAIAKSIDTFKSKETVQLDASHLKKIDDAVGLRINSAVNAATAKISKEVAAVRDASNKDNLGLRRRLWIAYFALGTQFLLVCYLIVLSDVRISSLTDLMLNMSSMLRK